MEQRQAFAAKQLIWAKVEPYPWWPGKVRSFSHADHQPFQTEQPPRLQSLLLRRPHLVLPFLPSCFLHENQLSRFVDFDQKCNDPYPFDFKLQKAISMANQAFAKLKLTDKSSDSCSSSPESESHRHEGVEQTIEENPI